MDHRVPAHVIEIVRLDTLEICKDSFIEKDLKNFYSDMLLQETRDKREKRIG
ncbi:Rpn family recombination-promoting nuclease/putative transposase [Desulfobacter postgatei]|uniref:Rpn family recombination-promoting nuclease/putative transposase n=1 Tax=Desulfobacter postgatei TaxID=2293 RepID=UPI00387E07BC